jgi:hypothetical protein
MEINEKTIQYLEEHIPELADAATKQAYWQNLALGNSVLVAENGELVEVFPDGTRQTVKKIEPFAEVQKGTVKIK